MINIKTMFRGMVTEKGKIHYCYITNNCKETFCKVNSLNSIKAVNYFAKVDCGKCLEKIGYLHDFVRVVIWHSNGFFYKGLIGININSNWVNGFDNTHIDIDINMFPEDLIDKNNIKEFISASENYIPLIKFINDNNIKINNLKNKIWILKTDFDIEADKKREEEKLLQKKKQEVKEQTEEKDKKTKVILLPYMRGRFFRGRFFNRK